MRHEPSKTYQEANLAYDHRTGSDWMQLRTKTCPGGNTSITRCGQRFKVEVEGQAQCRDCHAVNGTGFYAEGVEQR